MDVQPQGVVTQQPNTTNQQFEPSQISRAYSAKQWQAKEDWYTDQVNRIRIGDMPTPAEIQQIAAQIDALLSMARIDYAYISQNYDRYSMQLKIEERRLFVDLKLQPPTQYAGLKLTVDEMKGVVASTILNNNWPNHKRSLYKLVEEASSRNIFMEAVIKVLQDKKDLLITHSGMLKIENSLNSLTPSVPKGGSVPNGERYY